MAFFGVTKEVIEKVRKHPGADRLDIVKLKGLAFQFVTQKDLWKEGEECLYFPVDSLFPPDLLLSMGVGEKDEQGQIIGKLAGPQHNRLKTIRLRGEISQGMIGPLSLIADILHKNPSTEEITKYLQVEKYEPIVLFDKNANLIPLPDSLPIYDIEGADRYSDVAEELMDVPVVITEKVEGTNFSVYVHRDGTVRINQRRFSVIPREGSVHSFWTVAERENLIEKAQKIREDYNLEFCVIYGEFIGPGIMGNIYSRKDLEVLIFDIRHWYLGVTQIGLDFFNWKTFKEVVEKYEIKTVPVLEENKTLREILQGQTIQDYSNGQSVLAKTKREGIVIRPVSEQYSEVLGGRLLLKQRSPVYLSKSDF